MNITKAAAMKEIRGSARNVGLVFKETNARLSGAPLYKLCVRETGEILIDNYLFWSAFEDQCSGYISSWDGTRFDFAKGE